jgi:hypothetical protein
LDDVERKHITVDGSVALKSASLERAIVDLVLEVFQLDTRINSALLLMEDVLMHDDNHRSALGVSESSNSSNLDGRELMVIDASDVNNTVGR